MYEVEVKARADHDRVRERLAEIGAEPGGTAEQADTYYDAPDRSFAETDEALRLRETGECAWLTYKGPKMDEVSKTREERETPVGDPAATDAILRAVGFSPVATVEKERERFRHAGYTVALDRVAGLGEFVEVEAEGDEAEVPSLREGALDLLDRLEVGEMIRASYLELLLE